MKGEHDKDLFAIRALAFALLECRSQAEALRVMRYFAMPKPRFAPASEPRRGPDEPAEISK